MINNDFSIDDLEQMRKEVKEFKEIVKDNRIEDFNPDYHVSKEMLADMLGVSKNQITELSKKWEERGIFKRVDIRFPNGHRGVGFVLLPNWKENVLKYFEENDL